MVDSRWAITNEVRPASRTASASCTRASVSESRCEVASSRIGIEGPFNNAPSDGQALLLAAGEAVASLTDHRVVAVGQPRDHVVYVVDGDAHRLGQQAFHRADVEVEPGLNLTALGPREEGKGHPLQVVVEGSAKAQDHARANPQARPGRHQVKGSNDPVRQGRQSDSERASRA